MDYTSILKQTFLFKNLDDKTISDLLSENSPQVVSYKRGDRVYSSTNFKAVGFILDGRCEIRRDRNDGSKIVLNTLSQYDSFGILSIFSDDEFPTQIYATKNSQVMYFSDAQINHFVNNYSQISLNLIKFLTGRISFLNKKITTFSGACVEEKLAAFLLCEIEKHSSNTFPFNYQKTADEINAGRASVYRAIGSLTKENIILIADKQINIINRPLLERIIQ